MLGVASLREGPGSEPVRVSAFSIDILPDLASVVAKCSLFTLLFTSTQDQSLSPSRVLAYRKPYLSHARRASLALVFCLGPGLVLVLQHLRHLLPADRGLIFLLRLRRRLGHRKLLAFTQHRSQDCLPSVFSSQ